MSILSNRARNLKPSPTLAITAKAKSMTAQGINVISFGAGEPDFDTPDNIKKAAIRASLPRRKSWRFFLMQKKEWQNLMIFMKNFWLKELMFLSR